MLDSNKNTNFNKKSHFKAFVYVSYNTYNFTIRYTHCIIRFMSTYDTLIRYGTFYSRYDTYRVSYDTNNYGGKNNKPIVEDGYFILLSCESFGLWCKGCWRSNIYGKFTNPIYWGIPKSLRKVHQLNRQSHTHAISKKEGNGYDHK